MRQRGILPAVLGDSLTVAGYNRATSYRLVSGETTDPRVGSFLALANGLRGNPSHDVAYLLDPKLPPVEVAVMTDPKNSPVQILDELIELDAESQRITGVILRSAVDFLKGKKRT